MDVMGQFINSSFQRLCRRRRGERRWAFTKKGLPFSATHFYNISQTLQVISHKRKKLHMDFGADAAGCAADIFNPQCWHQIRTKDHSL